MHFSVEELQHFEEVLKLRVSSGDCEYKHVDDLLREGLLRHAEKDRLRGVPFLQPTRLISNEYKIAYNEHIELFGDEIAYTAGLLDDVVFFEDDSAGEREDGVLDVQESGESNEDVVEPESETEPGQTNEGYHLPSLGNGGRGRGRASKFAQNPERGTERPRPTATVPVERGTGNKDSGRRPVQQPPTKGTTPHRKVQKDEDALWSSILSATQEAGVPTDKGSSTRHLNTENTDDLIVFVRNNNGVTVRDALSYFSAKEINAQVRRGRIFRNHGRLSI